MAPEVGLLVGIAVTPMLLYCLYRYGTRLLDKVIVEFIESLDETLLGVNVHIDSLDLHPCRGRLDLHGVTVENPPGYKSEYALGVEHLCVDLDMKALLCSRARLLKVEELLLNDVKVNIETGQLKGGSNVQDIMNNMKLSCKEESHLIPEEKPKQVAHRETLLGKFAAVDISANFMNDALGTNFSLDLADMKYDDFSSTFGKVPVREAVRLVLQSLLRSVISNLAGAGVSDILNKQHGRHCCDPNR